MALSTFNDFLGKMVENKGMAFFTESHGQNLAAWFWGSFATSPGGASTLNRASAGVIRDVAATRTQDLFPHHTEPFIGEVESLNGLGTAIGSGHNHPFLIYDRLCHTSGIVCNVATPQTTNLPTPALPRYTTGEGVLACLVGWSNGPGVSIDVTMSYTNTAGVSGRTSPAKDSGQLSAVQNNRMIVFSLQDGDLGVKSVESITFASAGASAGDLGVMLFKPLFMFTSFAIGRLLGKNPYKNGLIGGGGSLIEYDPDACLDIAAWMVNTAADQCQFMIRTFDAS